MEEDIKINEYIRTSYGEIGQYIGVDTKFEMYDYDVNGNRSSCNYNELVKHSPNIIDLIEVRRLCKWIPSKKNE